MSRLVSLLLTAFVAIGASFTTTTNPASADWQFETPTATTTPNPTEQQYCSLTWVKANVADAMWSDFKDLETGLVTNWVTYAYTETVFQAPATGTLTVDNKTVEKNTSITAKGQVVYFCDYPAPQLPYFEEFDGVKRWLRIPVPAGYTVIAGASSISYNDTGYRHYRKGYYAYDVTQERRVNIYLSDPADDGEPGFVGIVPTDQAPGLFCPRIAAWAKKWPSQYSGDYPIGGWTAIRWDCPVPTATPTVTPAARLFLPLLVRGGTIGW